MLRIESPGGSSMASDVMWRELTLLAEKKPLIVSMGSVAASGGYYIAAPGREIYALPLTITGSIGIFYGKADLSELLNKIGVNIDTFKSAPRADAESLYRGFTEDEKKELDHKIHQFYDTFLDRVSHGRHMKKEDVDAVGQGRVWTGQEALDRKLVDEAGAVFVEALAAARKSRRASPDDAPIVELPGHPKSRFVERALELAGFAASPPFMIGGLPVPDQRRGAGAIVPLAVYSASTCRSRGWSGCRSRTTSAKTWTTSRRLAHQKPTRPIQ